VNGKKLRVSRLSAEQGGNVRDTNIDLIGLIMEALNKEHEFVYAPPPPPGGPHSPAVTPSYFACSCCEHEFCEAHSAPCACAVGYCLLRQLES